MCFYSTEHAKAKIAKTDIVCWKVLNRGLIAPFRRFRYKYGVVTPLVKISKEFDNEIYEGYHSYHYKTRADRKALRGGHKKVHQAIIPAGTRYYSNRDGEFVSEQLMIVKQ